MVTVKKLCILLIVFSLMLASVGAMASSSVTDSFDLTAKELKFNPRTNTFAYCKEGSSTYVLINSEGRELTTKPYIYMSPNVTFFEVSVESGVNTIGMIDGDGNEVMPMQYGDVQYLSDRWLMGVVLEDATVDHYDYKSYDGEHFYLIAAYDFYYCGAKAGSLSRTEYEYAAPHGAFLYVKDKLGNFSYYDSAFNKSAYTGDGGSAEYEENFIDHSVWHLGSNQQAFVPGCTLTPDDVDQDIYCINNQFFDLQGNLLFVGASPYDRVRDFAGDYAAVTAFGKYGLINRQGEEVVPCAYDSISCYDVYMSAGYQFVIKDGKVGYVDAQGNETTEFKYGKDLVPVETSPFTYLKNLENKIIVISAAIGELPDLYDDVQMSSNMDGCPLIVVEKNDNAGVIDLYGNMVIPMDGTYGDCYNIGLSNDGTVAFGYRGDKEYTIYHIEHTQSGPANEPAAESAGEWTCPGCGTANEANFCPQCGTARPQAALCSGCGYQPEGEMPNFCPQCGAKFE